MMGMRFYGFIPICDNEVNSSYNGVWGLQDHFFTLFAIIGTGVILFVVPMEPWFVMARIVTDLVGRKEVTIEYYPTNEMIADYMTKPLVGSKFKLF